MIAGAAWFFYALGAAVLWGLGYVLSDKIMDKGISSISLLFLEVLFTLPVILIIAAATKSIKPGFETLFSDSSALIHFLIMTTCFILGGLFIFKSIDLKNATYANIIEISYPAFTIFFSWILFKEFHLSVATIGGAALIFAGVLIIYLKG